MHSINSNVVHAPLVQNIVCCLHGSQLCWKHACLLYHI